MTAHVARYAIFLFGLIALYKIGGSSRRSSYTAVPVDEDEELDGLDAEIDALFRVLKTYEEEFALEHGRRVGSFQDIRPVASEYRRYKDMREAIARKRRRRSIGS